VANVPPLSFLCFIGGNSHPTIPYRFKDDQRIGHASADTQRDRGNDSRLYEVNIWMWRYGWGRPRMVSIAEAERIRAERLSESRTRAAETRKRRSVARWPLPQRGRRTAAVERIEHWPIISYVKS
jgi:hypothetical protein